VHKTNERLAADLDLIVKYKVPIVITSLGARAEVNDAVHSYGGFVFHDVINNAFARKAIAKGADGLVAVAAGAGGHAGTKSPFALVREIRQWFDGPLALAGAISTGDEVLAAQAMGADFAYIGSAFVATVEARVSDAYKQAIVDGSSDDIVYTNLFSGVHGNYLRCSIINAGLDPDNLPVSHAGNMNWTNARQDQKWSRYAQEGKMEAFEGSALAKEEVVAKAPPVTQAPVPKAWKEIWGAGHGIASIKKVVTVAEYVERLSQEYEAARARLLGRETTLTVTA
jgi:nitronate monooxygenase